MLAAGAARVRGEPAGYVAVHTGRPFASVAMELVVQAADVEHVRAALPRWAGERAILHTLPDGAPGWTPATDPEVGLRPAAELAQDASLPAPTRTELATLEPSSPVAVVELEGRIASLCFAGGVTERWWDISVETLEGYRGRGLAGACTRRLIAHYGERGRRPVWGAEESNGASLRVARKLGFVPAGELFVFRRVRG